MTLKLKQGKDQVAKTNFKQGFIGLDNTMLSLFFPPIFRFAISVTDLPGRLPIYPTMVVNKTNEQPDAKRMRKICIPTA